MAQHQRSDRASYDEWIRFSHSFTSVFATCACLYELSTCQSRMNQEKNRKKKMQNNLFRGFRTEYSWSRALILPRFGSLSLTRCVALIRFDGEPAGCWVCSLLLPPPSPTSVSSHHFLSDFRRRHRKYLPRISTNILFKKRQFKEDKLSEWAIGWVKDGVSAVAERKKEEKKDYVSLNDVKSDEKW